MRRRLLAVCAGLAIVLLGARLPVSLQTAYVLDVLGYVTVDGMGLGGDVAPSDSLIIGQAAYPRATVNTSGGDVVIAPGIGRRLYTVVARANSAGDTYTVTVNGAATAVVEGVDFTCADAASADACATNLAAELGTIAGIDAVATSAIVYLQKEAATYSLTIATSDATGIIATSGANGTVSFGGAGGLMPSSTIADSILIGFGAGAGMENTNVTFSVTGDGVRAGGNLDIGAAGTTGIVESLRTTTGDGAIGLSFVSNLAAGAGTQYWFDFVLTGDYDATDWL